MSAPIPVWRPTAPILSACSVSPRRGLSGSLGGRFDEQTFEMQRLQAKAGYTTTPFSVEGQYTFIQAQPLYGFPYNREEVTVGARTRFAENWTRLRRWHIRSSAGSDGEEAFGFGYADECFTFDLTLSQDRKFIGPTREIDETQSIGFQISRSARSAISAPTPETSAATEPSWARSDIVSPHSGGTRNSFKFSDPGAPRHELGRNSRYVTGIFDRRSICRPLGD